MVVVVFWKSSLHLCNLLICQWSSSIWLTHFNLVRLSCFANDLCLGYRAVSNFRSFSRLLWLFLFTGLSHVLSTCTHCPMDTQWYVWYVDIVLFKFFCASIKCFSQPEILWHLANPPLLVLFSGSCWQITNSWLLLTPTRIKFQASRVCHNSYHLPLRFYITINFAGCIVFWTLF